MMIKEKKAVRFRHELKHSISPGDDLLLSHRLRKLFPHDQYADSHGIYRVSSLYFDTPYDKALREKLDGVNQREKFRLRYYNNDTSFIRLEKKIKINGLCGKYSAPMSAQEADLLLRGEFSFLLNSEQPLFSEFYSKIKGQLLRPQTMVIYDREAFFYSPGNVRITLDRNLHTRVRNVDFLHPGIYGMNVSEGLSVLEVKYDDFLPQLVRMAVQVPGLRTSAFSKYAVCRCYD